MGAITSTRATGEAVGTGEAVPTGFESLHAPSTASSPADNRKGDRVDIGKCSGKVVQLRIWRCPPTPVQSAFALAASPLVPRVEALQKLDDIGAAAVTAEKGFSS